MYIGCSQKCITPPSEIDLYHLDGIKRTSDKVLDNLFVKTLILNHKSDYIVIICVDLIWVSKELTLCVEEFIHDKYNISPHNVLLCATHTHSSPQINTFNTRGRFVCEEYISYILGIIQGGIEEAFDRQESGYIKFGTGKTGGTVYRRKRIHTLKSLKKFRLKKIIANRPNVDAKFDNSIIVLRLFKKDGASMGLLYNLCCHPSLFRGNAVSGDFPAYISRNLSKKFGNNFITYFLQGFSGNINAKLVYRPQFSFKYPFTSIYQKIFDPLLFDKDLNVNEINDFSMVVVKEILDIDVEKLVTPKFCCKKNVVELSFENNSPDSCNSGFSKKNQEEKVNRNRKNLMEKNNRFENPELVVQKVSLSESLSLLTLSGEIFNEYSQWVRERYENKIYILPVSCANGMVGYIPDAKSLNEGGYEPERSLLEFGLKAKFSPSIEEKIKQAIIAIFSK